MISVIIESIMTWSANTCFNNDARKFNVGLVPWINEIEGRCKVFIVSQLNPFVSHY
jgi:hypothetical protein